MESVIKSAPTDLPERMLQVLEKYATENNLNNCAIEKENTGSKGDGYMGVITFLKLNGNDKDGSKITLNIVAKCAYSDESLRETTAVQNVFQREITMYTEVFPEFKKFQKEFNLANSFNGTTSCLCVSKEVKHEMLFLQNIKELGYKLVDKHVPMDNNHLEIVLKEYAKFHAISMAMKHLKPDLFSKLTKGFEENIFDGFTQNYVPIYSKCMGYVATLFERNEHKELVERLEKTRDNMFNILDNFQKSSDNHSSVVLHGDCWSNNMMFKYDDPTKPDFPTKICFLDFQNSRLGSLVFDLSYFFYSCASIDAVRNIDYYFENVYFKSLQNELKGYGLEPEHVYSIEKLRIARKEQEKHGFLFAAIICWINSVGSSLDLSDLLDVNLKVEKSESTAMQRQYNDKMKLIALQLFERNAMYL